VGFVATVGVLLAVALGAAVYSVRSTLVLVFLALFIAVGMEPVVGFSPGTGCAARSPCS